MEKDPTAFYTYEEFETGVETMRQFCALRSESISMQLANGETTSNMGYVDASGLTLSDMGSMGGKGGFGGGMPSMSGDKGSFGGGDSADGSTSAKPNSGANTASGLNAQGVSASTSGSKPQNGGMTAIPEGFDPSQMQGGFGGQMPNMGEMPEDFDPSQMPGGFGNMFPGQSPNGATTPSADSSSFDAGENSQSPSGNNGQTSDGVGTTDPSQSSNGETTSSADSDSSDSGESSKRPSGNNGQMPGGSFNPSMNGMNNAALSITNWIWLAVSVLILVAGLVIAKLYKKY